MLKGIHFYLRLNLLVALSCLGAPSITFAESHIPATFDDLPEMQTPEEKLIHALDNSNFEEKEALRAALSKGMQSMDENEIRLLDRFLKTNEGAAIDEGGTITESTVKSMNSPRGGKGLMSTTPELPKERSEASTPPPLLTTPMVASGISPNVQSKLNDLIGTIGMSGAREERVTPEMPVLPLVSSVTSASSAITETIPAYVESEAPQSSRLNSSVSAYAAPSDIPTKMPTSFDMGLFGATLNGEQEEVTVPTKRASSGIKDMINFSDQDDQK